MGDASIRIKQSDVWHGNAEVVDKLIAAQKEQNGPLTSDPRCEKCKHDASLHHNAGGKTTTYCHEQTNTSDEDFRFCGCTHGAVKEEQHGNYVFYAVADREDLDKAVWYRTYDTNHNAGFVKEFEDARIWLKRGQAQAMCTRLGPNAKLVEFVTTKINVIDQRERLKAAVDKKREEAQKQKLQAQVAAIAQAEEQLAQAWERLRKLRGDKECACGKCKTCMGM